MVRFLNAYFERVNQVLQAHGGEIDKLIGDGIMATFPDPESAVRAACAVRQVLAIYNEERARKNRVQISNGVGISYGPVVAGNIGSSCKLDFTYVGNTVNTASRVESLTKQYGCPIIITESAFQRLETGHHVRFLDRVQPYGKHEPISLYEVFDFEPSALREFKQACQAPLDQAYELYRTGQLEAAHAGYTNLINAAKQLTPDGTCPDPVLLFYRRRCEELNRHIKAGLLQRSDWQGVYSFAEK